MNVNEILLTLCIAMPLGVILWTLALSFIAFIIQENSKKGE